MYDWVVASEKVVASENQEIRCDEAITRVFAVLGKRWTGPIISVLLDRPARFAEIVRAIPGITEGMLSARLAELKEVGLVDREVRGGPPIAAVYQLTEAGQALRPGLRTLARWAERHLMSPGKESRRPRRAPSAERSSLR